MVWFKLIFSQSKHTEAYLYYLSSIFPYNAWLSLVLLCVSCFHSFVRCFLEFATNSTFFLVEKLDCDRTVTSWSTSELQNWSKNLMIPCVILFLKQPKDWIHVLCVCVCVSIISITCKLITCDHMKLWKTVKACRAIIFHVILKVISSCLRKCWHMG